MPRRARANLLLLTDMEIELMRAVWDRSKASAVEVQMDLVRRRKQIAYTTVKTMLDRLVRAGICNAEEIKGRYYYSAKVTPDRVAKEWYRHLQKMIFAGKGRGRFSKAI